MESPLIGHSWLNLLLVWTNDSQIVKMRHLLPTYSVLISANLKHEERRGFNNTTVNDWALLYKSKGFWISKPPPEMVLSNWYGWIVSFLHAACSVIFPSCLSSLRFCPQPTSCEGPLGVLKKPSLLIPWVSGLSLREKPPVRAGIPWETSLHSLGLFTGQSWTFLIENVPPADGKWCPLRVFKAASQWG